MGEDISGTFTAQSLPGSVIIMEVLSRSLISKAVQSLGQSCPSSGCVGRTLKGSTGALHPVTLNSNLPVTCVEVLVTKFPLGSWEHDTILYTMPKPRPNFNPHLQTYPDKTKACCCRSYLFPKWYSRDLCSAVSMLPSRSPVLSIYYFSMAMVNPLAGTAPVFSNAHSKLALDQ